MCYFLTKEIFNMKKYLIYILTLWFLIPAQLFSQPFGNEWIDINQSYYRFSIPSTGIYKVTNAQLTAAGIPVSNFNPQNIQLFFKGEEIPCYIEGESQGVIEYLLFYAEKNNGWFDVEMYDDSLNQTNPNHSLINDNAAVFFTWNNSFNNKRFTLENDTDFAGYTPESYCWTESHIDYSDAYYPSIEDCEYIEAEGWFDNIPLKLGASITKEIATPNFIHAGFNSELDIAYVTFSKYSHHINVSGPGFETDSIFSGLKSIHINKNLDVNTLNPETSIVFKSIDDLGGTTCMSAVSFINLKYTRGFNVEGSSQFQFTSNLSSNKKTYIEVVDFKSDGKPYLFDLTNNLIIKIVETDNLHKGLIPISNEESELILIDENTFLSPSDITESKMLNHSNKNKDYVIISHTKLMESAQSYANYRNAYLVDVEQIYNQFGYGIQKHPMAIRNYLRYIFSNWDTKPSNLFIIGKAVESKQTRYDANIYRNCLVPTMGQYGSDILLSNGILSAGFEAALCTGRLAAQSNADVYLYLDKVQEFEQNTANEWMKRAIHFGGGINSTEQAQFKGYLKNYENIFIDTLFGGYVSTFLKTSSDPIEISKSDSISNLINNGISLMTFFGHGSAANGFDQDIDDPSSFNNKGKYPLIIANSCYSGNIHLNGKLSESEDWVLIKDKGTIGFFAVVGSGYSYYLNIASELFYKNLNFNSYGKTLGEIIKESHIQMQANTPNNRYVKITVQEFTLHGDPAIVLNSFPLPDLTLKSSGIRFSPQNLTTEIDSFFIYIVPTNQAKTTNQTFSIDINRVFQTGKNTNSFIEVDGLKFKDTVKVKLPIDKVNGIGVNKFIISIDNNNQVEELDETNNVLEVSTFISSTDVTPVYPYKYSINSINNITLKLSTIDALAEEQTTVIQIDTTELFNSPLLYFENIIHSGGIVEWQPSISFEQGVVYYWRSAKESDDKSWSQSSFTLENAKDGWHQSHYGQYIDNSFKFLDRDDSKREFEFTDAAKTLICENLGTPSGEEEWQQVAFGIDGIGGVSSCGASSAMILVVIDSLSLLPWQSDYGNLGDIGHVNDPWCDNKTKPQNYFIFHSADINNITKLVDFVENEVPDDNYILIYSFRNGNFQSYNEYILSKFESWGAYDIRIINNDKPYIFFTKKGDISSAVEVIGADVNSKIKLSEDLNSNFTYGSIISQTIGPAKSWQTLNWSSHKMENNIDEIAYIQLYGINNSDQAILLKDSITSTSYNLNDIDVNSYPYLKLVFFTRDEVFRTPSHLDLWEVLYEPVTDLALNPQKGFEFYNDTLQEGEEAFLTMAFENIGMSDVDSTIVNYWVQNSRNENIHIKNHKIAPLKAGEFIIDTLEFSSLNFAGNNSLWVELNPATTQRAITFREQYYFNNLVQKPFYVKKDALNPLLDVTFDGLHIMDGDLVSAKPEIVIQLKDENSYIPLNDTSLFSIYIKSSSTGIEKKIPISNNPDLQFIPAKLPQNKAQIIYNTQFIDDGTYNLRVQAKDLTGNESGSFDYLISFQVINESSITNVFNYPNPFSTSTRFVFELTGYTIPDEMRIEILTVTGRVIKVIYLEDLGPINIGKNISQYIWDGTDMYGDPLANGVYFYKVNARINGEELKIRNTGTSQYFKNGFGKMYLMR